MSRRRRRNDGAPEPGVDYTGDFAPPSPGPSPLPCMKTRRRRGTKVQRMLQSLTHSIENTRKRVQVSPECVSLALAQLQREINRRLNQKGWGTFASTHEALGIITEEYYELIGAVKEGHRVRTENELYDIAVACVFGAACLQGRTVDW